MGRVISFNEAVRAMKYKIAELFRSMSEQAKKGKAQQIFVYLASEMERQGEELLGMSTVETTSERYDEAFDKASSRMTVLTDLFSGKENVIEGVVSHEEIFFVAMMLIDDLIVFLNELTNSVRSRKMVTWLNHCINYEYGNKRQIFALMRVYKREKKMASRWQPASKS